MIPTNISQDWGGGTRGRVGAAIAQASAQTGVDFSYLFHQAKIESGFNPTAHAKTSSASGLYQFIEQTWLGMVKKHGADHGLGWAAEAIRQGQNGRYHIADPEMRRAILDLRNQPEAAASMAAELAADNQDYLQHKLGRPVEAVDLYLAHFLGAAGASRFLKAHEADPNARADAILPHAARANRWVFYNRDGSPRSLDEIRERFAAKFGGGNGPLPAREPQVEEALPVRMAALRTSGRMPAIAGPSPEYARLAYLMLAELGA